MALVPEDADHFRGQRLVQQSDYSLPVGLVSFGRCRVSHHGSSLYDSILAGDGPVWLIPTRSPLEHSRSPVRTELLRQHRTGHNSLGYRVNLPRLLSDCARFSINDRVCVNRPRPFRSNNALGSHNLFDRAVDHQDKLM